MSENHPERAVLSRIEEEQVLPILGIQKAEIWFVAGSVLTAMILQSFIGVEDLFVPLIGGALFVSVAAVYASPSHITTWRYLQDLARYAWLPTRYFAASEDAPSEMKNQGGLANITPFEVDTRTQELTNVEQAWTGAGAVKRTDGRVEAMVEITADNMDFAQSDEWATRQEAATEFANKALDGPLKFTGTTESFDIEDIIARLEDRVTDEDIRVSPTKRALLKEYKERRPQEIEDRGTQTLRAFLVVSIRQKEVTDSYQDEPGPLEKLSRIPILGLLFSPFTTTSGDLEESELHEAMLEQLDRRVHNEVMTEFVQKMPGFSGRRLSTLEMITLNARFWNGNKPVYDDLEDVVSEQSVKRRQSRAEAAGGENR